MRWLVNPFERIAGWQALFIGLAMMALAVVIGKIHQFFSERQTKASVVL